MADATATTTPEAEGKAVYAGGTRNTEGKLTDVPTDFDGSKCKPLRKKDFEKESNYLRHAGALMQVRGQDIVDKGVKWLAKAEQLDKFGDPAQLKKAQKLSRLRDQLVKLEAECEEEGIEVVE